MANYNPSNVTDVEKEKKRRKGLFWLLALLLVGTISGGMYGYWTEGVNKPDSLEKDITGTVNVGKGVVTKGLLTGTAEFTVTEKLVPTGMETHSEGGDSANVEVVELPVTVHWTDPTEAVDTGDRVTGKVTITPVVTFADGTDNPAKATLQKLVQVEIKENSSQADLKTTGTILTLGAAAATQATARVTLTEPDNKTEYQHVKGKAFKVTLTYAVTDVKQP